MTIHWNHLGIWVIAAVLWGLFVHIAGWETTPALFLASVCLGAVVALLFPLIRVQDR